MLRKKEYYFNILSTFFFLHYANVDEKILSILVYQYCNLLFCERRHKILYREITQHYWPLFLRYEKMRRCEHGERFMVYLKVNLKFYNLLRIPYLSLKAAVILNLDSRMKQIKLESYNNWMKKAICFLFLKEVITELQERKLEAFILLLEWRYSYAVY